MQNDAEPSDVIVISDSEDEDVKPSISVSSNPAPSNHGQPTRSRAAVPEDPTPRPAESHNIPSRSSSNVDTGSIQRHQSEQQITDLERVLSRAKRPLTGFLRAFRKSGIKTLDDLKYIPGISPQDQMEVMKRVEGLSCGQMNVLDSSSFLVALQESLQ